MIYLKYRHRSNYDFCEECNASLKWVCDGDNWIPCDTEPVLFFPGKGHKTVVYKHRIVRDALIYTPGMEYEEVPVYGLIPHMFNCRGEGYYQKQKAGAK